MGKFDEIFDDVVINAKAAAAVVSKKASTVYDTSKHKITAAEIRGEINKRLRDLGKFTYKRARTPPPRSKRPLQRSRSSRRTSISSTRTSTP